MFPVLLVCCLLLQLSIVVLSFCVPNQAVADLQFSSPSEGELVERLLTVSAGLFCHDAERCKHLIESWYICYLLTGESEEQRHCGTPIFDDLPIQLVSDAEDQKIELALCSDEEGCLCNATVNIKCCRSDEDLWREKEAARQNRADYMKQQLLELPASVVARRQRREAEDDLSLTDRSLTPSPQIYIGIKSSAYNYMKREAVRASWLGYIHQHPVLRSLFHVRFIIGAAAPAGKATTTSVGWGVPGLHAREINTLLKIEQSAFADLLLGDDIPVPDTYFTLTNKTLAFFAYVKRITFAGGHQPNFVMIVDDDVHLNIPVLLELLENAPTKGLYSGRVFQDELNGWPMKPVRTVNHRNYVSLREYAPSVWPRYVHGSGILLSWDIVQRLLAANSSRPTGTLEDVSIAVWLGLAVCEGYYDHEDTTTTATATATAGSDSLDRLFCNESIVPQYNPSFKIFDQHYHKGPSAILLAHTSDVPFDVMEQYHVQSLQQWRGKRGLFTSASGTDLGVYTDVQHLATETAYGLVGPLAVALGVSAQGPVVVHMWPTLQIMEPYSTSSSPNPSDISALARASIVKGDAVAIQAGVLVDTGLAETLSADGVNVVVHGNLEDTVICIANEYNGEGDPSLKANASGNDAVRMDNDKESCFKRSGFSLRGLSPGSHKVRVRLYALRLPDELWRAAAIVRAVGSIERLGEKMSTEGVTVPVAIATLANDIARALDGEQAGVRVHGVRRLFNTARNVSITATVLAEALVGPGGGDAPDAIVLMLDEVELLVDVVASEQAILSPLSERLGEQFFGDSTWRARDVEGYCATYAELRHQYVGSIGEASSHFWKQMHHRLLLTHGSPPTLGAEKGDDVFVRRGRGGFTDWVDGALLLPAHQGQVFGRGLHELDERQCRRLYSALMHQQLIEVADMGPSGHRVVLLGDDTGGTLTSPSECLSVVVFLKELHAHGANLRFLRLLQNVKETRGQRCVRTDVLTGDAVCFGALTQAPEEVPSECREVVQVIRERGTLVHYHPYVGAVGANSLVAEAKAYMARVQDYASADGITALTRMMADAVNVELATDNSTGREVDMQQWNKLLSIVRSFDFVLFANTFGDPQTETLLSIRGLLRIEQRPRFMVSMPNAPIPGYWAPHVDAMMAPSYFVGTMASSLTLGVPVLILPPGVVDAGLKRDVKEVACGSSSPSFITPLGDADKVATLLFVGRLDQEKSLGLLLKAVALINNDAEFVGHDHPRRNINPSIRVRLHVAGAGRMLSGLRALTRQLNIDDAVTFHGHLSTREIARLVVSGPVSQRVDLLVNPRVAGETYGLAHVDAALMGIPVLAFHRRANWESTDAGSWGVYPDDITGAGDISAILVNTVSVDSLRVAIKDYFAGRWSELTVSRAERAGSLCRNITSAGDEDMGDRISAGASSSTGSGMLQTEQKHRYHARQGLWSMAFHFKSSGGSGQFPSSEDK